MPIIKSAAKRARQTGKKTALNIHTKRQLKDATKAFVAAVDSKSKKTPEAYADLQKATDTAVKKNLFHINRAARIKARYAKMAKDADLSIIGSTKKATAKKAAPKKTAKSAKSKTAKK